MSLQRANGTVLTKAGLGAVYTEVPITDPVIQISEDLYETHRLDGTTNPPQGKRLRFHAGQIVPRSRLLACFPDAVVETITPAGGPVAGGTEVTIRGESYTPGSTVAFGEVAATGVQVVNETTITCTSPPAAEAGAVQVQVTTDAGASPSTGTFTYA